MGYRKTVTMRPGEIMRKMGYMEIVTVGPAWQSKREAHTNS